MNTLVFYIALPFIYGISFLPFWILYGISDVLNLILFKMIGYRKEVIITNLKKSFPEKSTKEIHKIHKDFNQFFCDMMVETIKTLTISKKEAVKRCYFTDTALLDKLYAEKKKVIFVLGHTGNWELDHMRMRRKDALLLFVIYKPL